MHKENQASSSRSEARHCFEGATSIVAKLDIIANDTADESVIESLETNNTNQRALLDTLRIDIRNRQL